MIGSATSVNGVRIRLTAERWIHIVSGHGELEGMEQEVLGTVAQPERIVSGGAGEFLAIRETEPGKYLVAIYRQESNDGFIITAFLTRRVQSLNKRHQLWP
jgi:hypothetical protein